MWSMPGSSLILRGISPMNDKGVGDSVSETDSYFGIGGGGGIAYGFGPCEAFAEASAGLTLDFSARQGFECDGRAYH